MGLLFGCSVNCLIAVLDLFGHFADWLIGKCADCLAWCLIAWLIGCVVDWWFGWLIYYLVGSFIGWFVGWMVC